MDYYSNFKKLALKIDTAEYGGGRGGTQLTKMFCERDEDLGLRSGVSIQQVSPLLSSQCGSYKLKLEVSLSWLKQV